MPNDNPPVVEVRFSRQFKRDIKSLAKRYRRIKSDIQPVIDQLESGEKPGDQIQGTPYIVYKVRAKNSDANRGKSGGYRIIYYVQLDDLVILITIYSKSDQSDMSAETIISIIEEVDSESDE